MYASAWVFTKLGDANGPLAVVTDQESAVEDLLGPPALRVSPSLEKKAPQTSSLEKIDETTEIY